MAVDPRLLKQIAPSGRLRAAINLGNVVLAQRGGPLGAHGASVDIAVEMGRRLGIPVDLVIYDAAGAVVAGLEKDRWDVAFLAIDPARAQDIAFSKPYVFIDGTYIVRDDAPYRSAAELDRPGVRIAVGKGAAYDLYLSRALKQASLVRAPTSPEAIEAFLRDTLDAAAGIREALVDVQKRTPDTRVLADSFNRIEQAIAIPKDRPDASRYVDAMLDQLKTNGFIKRALGAGK